MSKVLSHQGNAIKSSLIFHLTPIKMAKIKNTSKPAHAGKDVEQGEHFLAGGSADLYNHFGNQLGIFLENQVYLKIQLYHSWAYTENILQHLTKTLAQLCS